MSDDKQPQNPLEQLVELFVYAPVGMIYEYEDVLPKLVRRGKSQVQLARILGQMAAKKGQEGLDGAVGGAVGGAAGAVAKGITEFGTMVGLAPTDEERRTTFAAPGQSEPEPAVVDSVAETVVVESAADSLPIAGYDELRAKEVIALLDDLTAEQRERVARHEAANRNRKTVLAKLAALAEG